MSTWICFYINTVASIESHILIVTNKYFCNLETTTPNCILHDAFVDKYIELNSHDFVALVNVHEIIDVFHNINMFSNNINVKITYF